MGNTTSGTQRHVWLDREPDWEEYMQLPWRSEAVRELDKLGGLRRSAVRRGNSITARLGHLGAAVADQGITMEAELYKRLAAGAAGSKARGHHKRAELITGRNPHPQQLSKHTAERTAEAADGSQLLLQAEDLKTVVVGGRKCVVAAWRVKIHGARRRTMLVVLALIRLHRGVVAPQRCRRVNNWAWAVQTRLEDRLPRYVEDFALCTTLKASIEANKAVLESLCQELSSDSAILMTEGAAANSSMLGAMPALLELAEERRQQDTVTSLASPPQRASFSGLASPSSGFRSLLGGTGGFSLRAGRRFTTSSLPEVPLLAAARSPLSQAGSETGASEEDSPFFKLRAQQLEADKQEKTGEKTPSRQISTGQLIKDSSLVSLARRRLFTPSSETGAENSAPEQEEDEVQAAATGVLVSLSQTFSQGSRRHSSGSLGAGQIPQSKSMGRSLLSRTGGPEPMSPGRVSNSGRVSLPSLNHVALPSPSKEGPKVSQLQTGGPSSILQESRSPRTSTAGLGVLDENTPSPTRKLAPMGMPHKPAPKQRVGFGSSVPTSKHREARGHSEPGFTASPPQPQPSPPTHKPSGLSVSLARHTAHQHVLQQVAPGKLPSRLSAESSSVQPPEPAAPPAQQGTPAKVYQPSPPPFPRVATVLVPTPSDPAQHALVVPQVVVPQLLPRSIAGLVSMHTGREPDAGAADTVDESQLDERTRLRLRLNRIRRGQIAAAEQAATSGVLQEVSSAPLSPYSQSSPQGSGAETKADPSAAAAGGSEEHVPGLLRYQEAPTDQVVQQSFVNDNLSLESGEWKQKLIEEIEALDRPSSVWAQREKEEQEERDREAAELAKLTTPQDVAERQALERIQKAAKNARTALLESNKQPATPPKNNTKESKKAAERAAAARAQAQERADKIQNLTQQLEIDVEALHTVENRLLMHVNRTNCSWAESQTFQPPDLWPEKEVHGWLSSPQGAGYKTDVLQYLANGQVAVHVNTLEDYVPLPDGDLQNLWCAEPWSLLAVCRPGLASQTYAAAAGLSYGGRAILQLVAAVQASVRSGDPAKAVSNLWVVLAVDDEMQHAVVKDMWQHRFYGLKREHVVFTMQTRRPGHKWNHDTREFEEDELSDTFAPGSGVSLMQLSWSCEAFILGPDGAPEPIKGSALELLEERRVEWIISRRARDLGLISREGSLPLTNLAYACFLKEKALAGMVTDVQFVRDIQQSRALDSLVLGCKSIYNTWREDLDSRYDNKELKKLPLISARSVLELSHLELQSADVLRDIYKLRSAMGGKLPVSCGRHIYHLQTLKSVIAIPNIFRPKLQLVHGTLAHVALHAADITTHPAMRCLGMVVPNNEWHGALTDDARMETLLSLLQAQDDSPEFRKLISSMPGRSVLRSVLPSTITIPPPAMSGTGQRVIVVFVASNRVSQVAVDIACSVAKAGRDCLKLVTFVSNDLAREESQELLIRLYRSCVRPGLSVSTDVLVRGESGLLDCMEQYLMVTGAHLAVMGSMHLTAAAGNFVVGSVTLAFVRRITTPVLVVTANSSKHADGYRAKLRLGVLTESTCRGVHNFLCEGLADSARGDHLVFFQPHLTAQQQSQQSYSLRRLNDSLTLTAKMNGLTVLRSLPLEGHMDAAVTEAIDTAAVNILGIQVGGHTIPQWLQTVLSQAKCAVLLFRNKQEAQKGIAQ